MPQQKGKQKVWLQLLAVTLLIGFPLLMLFVNGTEALKAILWKEPSTEVVHTIKTDTVFVKHPVDTIDTVEAVDPDKPQDIFFGAFDPDHSLDTCKQFTFEHLYISWVTFNDSALLAELNAIDKRRRTPLLTIEPWPYSDTATLLTDVVEGVYNERLQHLAALIQAFNYPIYVSWGHEMDQDLTSRYPWSGRDPQQFIAAYRYVHDQLEPISPDNLKWIWDPVVKPDCEQYYPGDEYVDLIGMPIYSFPAFDKSFYGHTRDFNATMDEKYQVVSKYKKPIVIVEMGVAGDADFRSFWLNQAFASFSKYPLLEGVVFFYDKDTPGAWGKDLPTPDWRTKPTVITDLIDWWNSQEM